MANSTHLRNYADPLSFTAAMRAVMFTVTVIVAGAMLSSPLALGQNTTWQVGDLSAAIAASMCSDSPEADPASPCVVHRESSDFNRRVFVVDGDGFRAMRFAAIDGEDQTRIRPGHPEQLPMPYLRSAAVGLAVPQTLERLLVIGLGGGAFPAYVGARLPAVHVDAVEIDPVVVRIAVEFFDVVERDRLRIHVMDAVEYVKQKHAPYDYILLDAYGADELPGALTTSIFLGRVHDQLTPGGVLAVNIALRSDFRTRALIDKIHGFFDYCLRMQSTPSRNDVLLLSDTPLPERSKLRSWAERFDAGAASAMRDHIASAQRCSPSPG